jgi:hypothetical protein
LRPALKLASALVMLASTVWFLAWLAQFQLTTYLRDEAARALASAAAGDTAFEWKHSPDDVIGGRVFEAAKFHFATDSLTVEAGAQPFEIGLPLSGTLSLLDFPRLHFRAHSPAGGSVQVVVRETLAGEEWLSAPLFLDNETMRAPVPLDALAWQTASRTSKPAPTAAAMLRLRFTLPVGAKLEYTGAELQRAPGAPRLRWVVAADASVVPSSPLHTLAAGPFAQQGQIAALVRAKETSPLLLLPQSGRVEQQVLALRAIRDQLPGAIVIPQAARSSTFAKASQQLSSSSRDEGRASGWIILVGYTLLLLIERWRAPLDARLRAGVELALVLGAPLWLVVGGQVTMHADESRLALMVVTALYALSLGYRQVWTWNGNARTWLFAAAVAGLAAVVGLALHRGGEPLRAIGPGHLVRYLGWALIQQYLICIVCLERWRTLGGSALAATYLSALCFALLHTPNADLMLATFFGGLCWCTLYLRERALLPLAFSHAASALLLIALLPPDVLLSAEVSARYFH